MAINFSANQNRQKYFILLLIGIVLITFFIWRKDIFKASLSLAPAVEVFEPEPAEIDFAVLENAKIKELQLPEPAKPWEGKAGRENPFISY